MRRKALWFITFIGGAYFLVEYILPETMPSWLGSYDNPLSSILPAVGSVIAVVVAMAILLGPINLVRTHVSAIMARGKNWVGSIVFLVSLAFTLFAVGGNALLGESGYTLSSTFQLMFDICFWGVSYGFGAASMALLAFYLVTAAYRAFRLTSIDAGVMMITATIVLLGMAPVGDWITLKLPGYLQLSAWQDWVLRVPNTAVQRAVGIGATGGGLAAGLRMWLGLGRREV